MQDHVGTLLSPSSRVVGEARARTEPPGARSAACGTCQSLGVLPNTQVFRRRGSNTGRVEIFAGLNPSAGRSGVS